MSINIVTTKLDRDTHNYNQRLELNTPLHSFELLQICWAEKYHMRYSQQLAKADWYHTDLGKPKVWFVVENYLHKDFGIPV